MSRRSYRNLNVIGMRRDDGFTCGSGRNTRSLRRFQPHIERFTLDNHAQGHGCVGAETQIHIIPRHCRIAVQRAADPGTMREWP